MYMIEKQYPTHSREDIFGWGLMNQLSASVLKHSVHTFTLPQADRFEGPDHKIVVQHVKADDNTDR